MWVISYTFDCSIGEHKYKQREDAASRGMRVEYNTITEHVDRSMKALEGSGRGTIKRRTQL